MAAGVYLDEKIERNYVNNVRTDHSFCQTGNKLLV